MIEQLKEYKKTFKIVCTNISSAHTHIFTLEVKLEQLKPHHIFKYEIHKNKSQISELYKMLDLEIFDFENPFNQNILTNIVKPNRPFQEVFNESLSDCTSRIDIMLNKHFIKFFSIHFHYPDYMRQLREQKELFLKSYEGQGKGDKKEIGQQLKSGNMKGSKQMSEEESFERLINMVKLQRRYEIELSESGNSVLNFIVVNYHDSELLFLMEQNKKVNKFKSYIKTFFSQTHTNGCISIYKRHHQKYTQTYSARLPAEPISMRYSPQTNMLMILTNIGVYVYLAKIQKKLEELQLFHFIELLNVVDFAINAASAEVYLLKREPEEGLYVYSEEKEKLMKLQYKYRSASSICFEDQHKRLYVSDDEGVHIYLVEGYMQVKRLHLVKSPSLYKKIIQNHGYLYCMSENGFITVIDLKPPQKEKLISITTNIDFPKQTNTLLCSPHNKRLILTTHRNCIVLIDSLQGPICSWRKAEESLIKSLFLNRESLSLYCLNENGELCVVKVDEQLI